MGVAKAARDGCGLGHEGGGVLGVVAVVEDADAREREAAKGHGGAGVGVHAGLECEA